MGCLGECILGWWTGVGPLMVATVWTRCNNTLRGRARQILETHVGVWKHGVQVLWIDGLSYCLHGNAVRQ